QPLGGEPFELDRIREIAPAIDLIICSSSAPHRLLTRSQLEPVQARRGYRPLLVIDLAVPRDVGPDVSQITGVQLFNIDDLQVVATANLEERKGSAPAAERIVAEELAHTRSALEARDSAGTIRALVKRAADLRDAELRRHLSNLPPDDEAGRQALHGL